jgi:hypothetical protein
LINGKDTMHKLSKAQYGELVREIQKVIKKHAMKGGGMYDFAAAETYVDKLPDIPLYVHVEAFGPWPQLCGTGFWLFPKGWSQKYLYARFGWVGAGRLWLTGFPLCFCEKYGKLARTDLAA